MTRDLGCCQFASVHAQMLELAEAVRKGQSRGEIWLLEHHPVFTAGRATPQADLRDDIVAIERGGQITYHGPGQLVVYPIIPLPRRDVRAWLQALEQYGVAICAGLGLLAEAGTDGTGVFVAGKKIASIGVAIRHWVNLHGIALNVAMDLTPFAQVRPCGKDPGLMSDLSRVAGRAITIEEVKQHARREVFLLTGPAPA